MVKEMHNKSLLSLANVSDTLSACLLDQGHSSFITHLDWSKDGKYIMSNSGDYEILYCKWTSSTVLSVLL